MDEQNRNLILATVLSFLVILVWFVMFPPEEPVSPATNEAGLDIPAASAPAADSGDAAALPTQTEVAADICRAPSSTCTLPTPSILATDTCRKISLVG